jgi:hypothetical protein
VRDVRWARERGVGAHMLQRTPYSFATILCNITSFMLHNKICCCRLKARSSIADYDVN